MRKVLVVADTIGWAFDKIYHGLKNNCKKWDVDVLYLHRPKAINLNDYDLIYYLCDNYLNPLIDWIQKGYDKNRVILGVRSEVDHLIYERKDLLEKTCSCLAVSNEKLLHRFRGLHSNVVLAEGGIDTSTFYYDGKRILDNNDIRIGWAGAVAHWGKEFRGIDITEQTCIELGYKWVPALREDKWRTTEEMVSYYKNDIDIYVEMSKSAGRQNGMIEAGAMSIPIISFDCGVARQVIKNDNGVLLKERTVESLKKAIIDVVNNYDKYSYNIKMEVDTNWSWFKQAQVFEFLFDEVYGNV